MKNLQINIETQFNKRLINQLIKKDIEDQPSLQPLFNSSSEAIKQWMQGDYYESKNNRLHELSKLDIDQLVKSIYVGLAMFFREELLSSVSAQLANHLGFDDKPSAVTTVAEIIGVLWQFGLFRLDRKTRNGSVYLTSLIPLRQSTYTYVQNCMYLPPMLTKPDELKSNYSSGYLTHTDSLILNNNHHDGNIGLDVLNKLNSVALSVNEEFLSTIEEKPNPKTKFCDPAQVDNWNKFMKQSHNVYRLMRDKGNKFYLTHKLDSRFRIYCQGYHINYQGASYKKATVELYKKEKVSGVPEHLRINK